MFINDDGGVSRFLRACYGKCGFVSLFIDTGKGITGVIEYEDSIVCDEGAE